jgi:threonine dehydratase
MTIDFRRAELRLRDRVLRTPITRDPETGLALKWESHQETRSFKVRGAFNKMLSLETRPELVITGSAGNHGLAVALAGRALGIQVLVYVPEKAPDVKVDRMRALEAHVERVPGLFAQAEVKAIRQAKARRVPFISPYNDPAVIAGAGTIATEWLAQQPDLGRILVPVGGGGLICGVGLAARQLNPEIEIIGVLSEASPFLYHQFYFGHMDRVSERPTLTDGLAGDVEPGSITIELLLRAVDRIVQVEERHIAAAVAHLYHRHSEVVEGSAAVGLAAVLSGKVSVQGRPSGTIISGGNIDSRVLDRLLGVQS